MKRRKADVATFALVALLIASMVLMFAYVYFTGNTSFIQE